MDPHESGSGELASASGTSNETQQDLIRIDEEVKSLRSRLELTKREVDALQAAAAEAKRPWYQIPSVITSVLALALSVTIAIVGAINSQGQRKRTARAELVSQISRVNQIAAELVALQDRYGKNQAALFAAAQPLVNEHTSAARRALDLAEEAGDLVSPTELNAVLLALLNAGFFNDAVRIGGTVKSRAVDALDRMVALRLAGAASFATGRLDDGRRDLGEAMALCDSGAAPNEGIKAQWIFDTRLFWATIEAQAGQLAEASLQLTEADAAVANLGSKAAKEAGRERLTRLRQQIEAGGEVPLPDLTQPGGLPMASPP